MVADVSSWFQCESTPGHGAFTFLCGLSVGAARRPPHPPPHTPPPPTHPPTPSPTNAAPKSPPSPPPLSSPLSLPSFSSSCCLPPSPALNKASKSNSQTHFPFKRQKNTRPGKAANELDLSREHFCDNEWSGNCNCSCKAQTTKTIGCAITPS